MLIEYFGGSQDFASDALYNSDTDGFDPTVLSASSTQIVIENPSTGFRTTFTGTGLPPDPESGPLTGTLTGIVVRDSGGARVAALSQFSWSFEDFVVAVSADIDDDNPGQLDALLSQQPITVDAQAVTDGLNLFLEGVTSDITFQGSDFRDQIGTGSGDDSLSGGGGRDSYDAHAGNDTIDASGGSAESQGVGDYIRPGLGNDVIIGHAGLWATGEGADLSYADLDGEGGVTITSGPDGTGTVTGAGGQVNDSFSYIHYFEGSQDGDVINGSSEDRWEGFSPLGGADTVNGNGGFDTLDYSYETDYFDGAGAGIQADLAAGTVIDTQGNTDVVSGIEEIRGTDLNDVMTAAGTSTGVEFRGEGGNDTLIGGDGEDSLRGGDGDDSLNPGDNSSFDSVTAGRGTDTINLSDALLGFVSIEHWDLDSGVTVTLDGNANTGQIDKGANGTTTILDVANPMLATMSGDGGLGIYGTTFADRFNITVADDGWMQVRGGDGADSYSIGASSGSGLRLDFRDRTVTSGVAIDLGAGTVSNDGFGNAETITGIGNTYLEVRGTNMADSLTGSAFDESFVALGGNDTIMGGGGYDRLRYDQDGASSGIHADLAAGSVTGSWEGQAFTDSVTGIERISGTEMDDVISGSLAAERLEGSGGNDILYGDEPIMAPIPDAADQVYRLYEATLDRAPDETGYLNWTTQIEGGLPLAQVATGFTNSTEFQNTYGDLDDEGFVQLLYQNVLGREADDGGLQYWLDKMDAGTTRAQVVVGFSQSSEFSIDTAPDLKAWMRGLEHESGTHIHDKLEVGQGNSVLSGGVFSDEFVFDKAASGSHVVLDLEVWDQLSFVGFGYAEADGALAHMTQAGDDVQFDDQGVSVLLLATELSDVTPDMVWI